MLAIHHNHESLQLLRECYSCLNLQQQQQKLMMRLLKYWAHNPIGYTWNLEQHKFHVEASNTSALLLKVPMAIRDELGQLIFALIK